MLLKRRLLAERWRHMQQQRDASPHHQTMDSLLPNPPSTTASGPASNDRESSAPPAVGRGEGLKDDVSERHDITEMERRLVDNLWNDSSHVQTSASHPRTVTTSTTSYHHSYHGETADQLRDRSRPTHNWDARRYDYTGAYGAQPLLNRPIYPPIHPQTSSPPFVPSPSPSPLPTPHIPPAGTDSPQQQQHIQSQSSQEWTEYMSAPADAVSRSTTGSSNAVFSPTSSTNGTSHRGLDSSRFDLNHS